MELAALLEVLTEDPWRAANGFSRDLEHVHEVLWDTRSGAEQREAALAEWLEREQICRFARLAVRRGALDLCIIDEQTIRDGDGVVFSRVQQARARWIRRSFQGRSAGIVILASARALAQALPGPGLAAFARRFAELYLDRPVEVDRVELDAVFLRDGAGDALVWQAPLNYFSAHGDGRWWRDRRIPGGVAFSINAVGQLVAAGLIDERRACSYAVATIDAASSTRRTSPEAFEASGHADYAVPSPYLTADVERPTELEWRQLAYTTDFRSPPSAGAWDEPHNRSVGGPRRIVVRESSLLTAVLRAPKDRT